ncbi:spore germination protein [Caproiciproducens galactitolivorans]|uniref:Spore germination protein n=1 Tax=Caproiciproducens galactitolivorans TaxID=642589 RepID=A0ABT4BPU4_9FIRM|nr:spore germination protein [Caproiciproducens galactitolivorans]MCY1712860.1 spore germination protein [Caproiciproducens galactitolivorans]
MGKNGISSSISENLKQITNTIGNDLDFTVRVFDILLNKHVLKGAVIFINGMADTNKLNSLSMELNETILSQTWDGLTLEDCFIKLKTSLLCQVKVSVGSDSETIYEEVLSGNTILLLDGMDRYLILNTIGPDGRSITESTSQTIIRGPKEAFTEKLTVNITLIRRIIKAKSLKIEKMSIGNLTKTNVAILYLDQIAKEEMLNEVRTRLKNIKVDSILDSGYIEEYIKDDPNSIFPTILNSERPDAVAGNLLEGKIAVLVDGSPYVLTVPAFFIDFMQVSEDYYHHYIISSFIRLLRYVALILTLIVPAFYIALTTFHQEMIPTTLLVSIAAQREGVPFPAFVEVFLMEIIFEILREAGIRMPRAVGSAISIVGALVLGQAAVQAGIISAFIVIIVSITAITSFAIPNYEMSNAVRIIRFGFMILSTCFGLFGVFIGLVLLTLHLSKLKSLGIPYMTPLAPANVQENKDALIRFPLWKMRYRPRMISKAKTPRVQTEPPVSSEQSKNQEIY